MGLLDLGIEDPNTTGLLSLGLRLMSTPGKFGTALGTAGLGAMGDMRQAQLLNRAQQQEALRQQMLEMQIAQAKQAQAEAQAQAQRDEAFRRSIPNPGFQASQAALAGGGGPTVANAAQIAPVDPRQQFLYEAVQARQIQPMDYFRATEPKQPDYKVVGDSLVQIGGGRVSEAYRAPPKPSETPSEYRLFELSGAKERGLTFDQWDQARRRAGATNIGLPKIDIKVGEGVAGQVGPLLKETREQALSGIKLVDSANRILEAAEKGNLYAGPTANLRLKGAQIADVLGLGGKDTQEKITNTRTVVRAMAEQGVAARSQLGGQAQISNSEQELLTRATSGDINDLTAGEIVQIATLNDRLGRQLYERHSQSLAGLKNTPNTENLTPFFQVPRLPAPFAPKRPGAPVFLGYEQQ